MKRVSFGALICVGLLLGGHARADEPAAPSSSPTAVPAEGPSDPVQVARHEFVAGTEFVRTARWGEALASFERSAAQRPHALTTYNVGACERALGRYARARTTLRAALAANAQRGGQELPASFAAQAADYLAEIDRLLARIEVTLVPDDAEVLVDGRPLRKVDDNALVTDGRNDGTLVRRPGTRFAIAADPGVHVFYVDRQGFARVAVSRSVAPGERIQLNLDLARLPATLRVSANEPSAVVSVGGLDVGVAPVQITRPSGMYSVVVRKPGYITYSASVDIKAGQETSLRAPLSPETKPLYAKPWFWIAAVAVVGGAAVTTYALTRPAPEAPAPDGGGLGWVVPVGR